MASSPSDSSLKVNSPFKFNLTSEIRLYSKTIKPFAKADFPPMDLVLDGIPIRVSAFVVDSVDEQLDLHLFVGFFQPSTFVDKKVVKIEALGITKEYTIQDLVSNPDDLQDGVLFRVGGYHYFLDQDAFQGLDGSVSIQ